MSDPYNPINHKNIMAKIYATPEHIKEPEIDYSAPYDYEKETAREEKFLAELKEWVVENGQGPLRGELVREGVADGYALYMVYSHKPFSMIHIRLGDGYSAGPVWERGVRISDVKARIKFDKDMAALMKKKETSNT